MLNRLFHLFFCDFEDDLKITAQRERKMLPPGGGCTKTLQKSLIAVYVGRTVQRTTKILSVGAAVRRVIATLECFLERLFLVPQDNRWPLRLQRLWNVRVVVHRSKARLHRLQYTVYVAGFQKANFLLKIASIGKSGSIGQSLIRDLTSECRLSFVFCSVLVPWQDDIELKLETSE